MTPEQVIDHLKEGNANYASGRPCQLCADADLLKKLRNTQNPYAVIVSCSDSRVPIELVFNAGPGELFVIRTAGNIVCDIELGSLEYAIEQLKTPVIVVVGHQGCGAIHAAVHGKEFPPELEAIVNEVRCCCTPELMKGDISEIENRHIIRTLSKIAANESVSKAVSQGTLHLYAAKYSLETGIVSFFN